MPVRSSSPAAPFPVADEFTVNSVTAGDQFDPVVTALAGGGYVILWASGSAAQNGTPSSLRAQRLDADGNKVGAEIVVDSSVNTFRDYRIEALNGGGFAVTWADNIPGDGGNGSNGAFGISAQLYSAAGAALGGPIQVNTTTNLAQDRVEIAELTDGKFVLVWQSAFSTDIRAQIFNADGSRFGSEFPVNETDTFEQLVPRITALNNGGFVVTWEDHSAAGGAGKFGIADQIDVRAQFYDSTGAEIGLELLVNSTTGAAQNGQRIITLAGGNVLIAWNDWSPGATGADVRAQLFDPAGNRVGGEFLINGAGTGAQTQPVLTALAGGGFVAAWFDDNGQVAPHLQVFEPTGNRVGSEVVVRPPDTVGRGVQTIVALADGGFVVGYDRSPSNNVFDMDAYMQVFTHTGALVGSATALHTDLSGNQSLGTFAIGADGRMLAVWMQGTSLSTDAADLDVKARLFDSGVYRDGDDTAEGLTGTSGVDVIYGFGGDDSIFGLAGNDYLNGGTGVDYLDGGSGNDTFYVDNANDVVVEAVGGGNDRVAALASYRLAAGVEVETLEAMDINGTAPFTLGGNEFAQRIVGNAGSNIIDGAGGNDRLEGGAGDDYLVGGTGADLMFGDSGNDTYYVDNAGDTIVERAGDGNDRVATSVSFQLTAGADVQLFEAINSTDTTALQLVGNDAAQTIVGNAGDNLIDGGIGSDTLYGLAGIDTFRFATALGAGNVDRLQDFQSGTDRIALDDAVFTTLTPGALPAGAFVIGTSAADADDRIIYDQATGRLFYDSDGNGAAAAVQFATLNAGQSLAASDFTVI